MEFKIAGKSALVIGASRGLGRKIALNLAEEGAKVGVIARSQPEIEQLVEVMGGESQGHWGIIQDLMPTNVPTQIAQDIISRNFPIDIIIHNLGGTLAIRDPFCSIEEWQAVWRLNFEIAAEFNRLLIPPMQEQQWGRVIHISSIAANLSRGSLPYCTVKAALNAYTKNLGATLAADGVTITAIMPGAIRHKGSHWDKVAQDNPQRVADFLEQRLAIKRFASVDEITDFVVFLCSQQASFFTGAIIPIDGGSW